MKEREYAIAAILVAVVPLYFLLLAGHHLATRPAYEIIHSPAQAETLGLIRYERCERHAHFVGDDIPWQPESPERLSQCWLDS